MAFQQSLPDGRSGRDPWLCSGLAGIWNFTLGGRWALGDDAPANTRQSINDGPITNERTDSKP